MRGLTSIGIGELRYVASAALTVTEDSGDVVQ